MIWKALVGDNLRAALAPTLQLQYPRECNMCNTSGCGCVEKTRAQGLKIKHSDRMYSKSWSDVPRGMQTLKLFSLGLRLMMMLNVSYGSSVPLWILLVMSCWYWFGSSHTRNVLLSPFSLGFGSGPIPEWRTKYGHFHFLLINTEGAGAIEYFWKKDWHERGLSIAPTGFTRREPFAVFRYLDRFFKQGTERKVKVNPTGLCCKHLSGVYVGVCHCARMYGYVGIVKSPY